MSVLENGALCVGIVWQKQETITLMTKRQMSVIKNVMRIHNNVVYMDIWLFQSQRTF